MQALPVKLILFETVLVIKMRYTNFIVICSDLVDIFYRVWL